MLSLVACFYTSGLNEGCISSLFNYTSKNAEPQVMALVFTFPLKVVSAFYRNYFNLLSRVWSGYPQWLGHMGMDIIWTVLSFRGCLLLRSKRDLKNIKNILEHCAWHAVWPHFQVIELEDTVKRLLSYYCGFVMGTDAKMSVSRLHHCYAIAPKPHALWEIILSIFCEGASGRPSCCPWRALPEWLQQWRPSHAVRAH